MTRSPTPGEGPVRPVSVSLHEGTIAALKARTGKRGMSALSCPARPEQAGLPAHTTWMTCFPRTPPASSARCAVAMSARGWTVSTTGRIAPVST